MENKSPDTAIKGLSRRRVEYKILAVSLVVALLGLALILDFLVVGTVIWESSALPLSMLVVCGPLALVLLMRLRQAEKLQPALKQDVGRRKVVQAILLIAFLAIIVHSIALLNAVISGSYGASRHIYDAFSGAPTTAPVFWHDALRWVVTIWIAGTAFWYCWRDERRND